MASPYVYDLSHVLKHVVGRYGMNVVFTAPNILRNLCPTIQKKVEAASKHRGVKLKPLLSVFLAA